MYKKVWKCDKCGNHLWEMVPEQGSTYATAFACDVCDKQAWVFVSCEYFPELKIERKMAPTRWFRKIVQWVK